MLRRLNSRPGFYRQAKHPCTNCLTDLAEETPGIKCKDLKPNPESSEETLLPHFRAAVYDVIFLRKVTRQKRRIQILSCP